MATGFGNRKDKKMQSEKLSFHELA